MEKSEIIKVRDIKQFFIFDENDKKNPVVLYVHGGPGLSETLIGFQIAARTNNELNWVFYDQRGAGRTSLETPGEMTQYEPIYEDLLEIVEMLYKRYNKKIYIMAHNWGTIPAIRCVRQLPKYVAGYIGYNQVVDMVNVIEARCERVVELATRAGAKGDIRKIEKIKSASGSLKRNDIPPKYHGKLNSLFVKYNLISGADKFLMRELTKSPIYEMTDLRIMMNASKTNRELLEYMKSVNLYEEDMKYQVPMMFITGDWDYSTPCTHAADYMNKLEAPHKQMSIIPDTTYNVMYEEPAAFWEQITEFINNTQ